MAYSADEPVPPRVDSNAPDYYIPRNLLMNHFQIDRTSFNVCFLVMSAITYVLVAGLALGIQDR